MDGWTNEGTKVRTNDRERSKEKEELNARNMFKAKYHFLSAVFGVVNNCVSTMITMINEDKERLVVMAVLSTVEEMLKTMKKDVLQGPGNFEGLCAAVKNVLMSKVSFSSLF